MNDTQRSTALDDLAQALQWEKSGWSPFPEFRPLFAIALDARLPVLPGNPSHEDARRVAREGLSALPATMRLRLKLDRPLPEPLQESLHTELEASHCGLMPKTAFGNMAVAQRFRDAHLAAVLAAASATHGRAVLLAGNGHVRADRGVPFYLRQMAPDLKAVTVLLLEVEDGKVEPTAYVWRAPDGTPVADYMILTPRADRTDPCEDMRKHFAKPPK